MKTPKILPQFYQNIKPALTLEHTKTSFKRQRRNPDILLWIPGTNFNCSKWAPKNHLTLYFFLEVKKISIWSEKKEHFEQTFVKKDQFSCEKENV